MNSTGSCKMWNGFEKAEWMWFANFEPWPRLAFLLLLDSRSTEVMLLDNCDNVKCVMCPGQRLTLRDDVVGQVSGRHRPLLCRHHRFHLLATLFGLLLKILYGGPRRNKVFFTFLTLSFFSSWSDVDFDAAFKIFFYKQAKHILNVLGVDYKREYNPYDSLLSTKIWVKIAPCRLFPKNWLWY